MINSGSFVKMPSEGQITEPNAMPKDIRKYRDVFLMFVDDLADDKIVCEKLITDESQFMGTESNQEQTQDANQSINPDTVDVVESSERVVQADNPEPIEPVAEITQSMLQDLPQDVLFCETMDFDEPVIEIQSNEPQAPDPLLPESPLLKQEPVDEPFTCPKIDPQDAEVVMNDTVDEPEKQSFSLEEITIKQIELMPPSAEASDLKTESIVPSIQSVSEPPMSSDVLMEQVSALTPASQSDDSDSYKSAEDDSAVDTLINTDQQMDSQSVDSGMNESSNSSPTAVNIADQTPESIHLFKNVLECLICGYQTSDINDSIDHINFHSKGDLKEPITTEAEAPRGNRPIYKCPVLECPYRSEGILFSNINSHTKRLHNMTFDPDSLIKCEVKPISTAILSNYDCPIESCKSLKFTTKIELNQHIKSIHPGLTLSEKRLYRCPIVECHFHSRTDRLKTHIQRVHKLSIDPKSCEMIGISFKVLPKYHCPAESCQTAPKASSDIKRHIKTSHPEISYDVKKLRRTDSDVN